MMAPMAMAVAGRAGIPPFLMAIMVGNGAQAGSLSPFAPTGIIVTGLMDKIGLPGMELRTYVANFLAPTRSSPSPATSCSAAGGCSDAVRQGRRDGGSRDADDRPRTG